MDTNNLIKSVLSENIVETKNIVKDILMQKLSERLQNKFDEYAPFNFLDEETLEEKKADKDYDGDGEIESSEEEWRGSRDKAIKAKMAEEDDEEGNEDEDEDTEEDDAEEDDEEDSEYEGGPVGSGSDYEDCESCNDNSAEDMNKRAFGQHGVNEETEQLDEVSPPGEKKMTHSKRARKSFKSQYGKKGKSVQYATAWKKHEEKKEE